MTADDAPQFLVAALYAFVPLPDYQSRQVALQKLGEQNGILGTLLLAAEGINGTISGPDTGIQTVLEHIKSWPEIEGLECKFSHASAPPFTRFKVRLKKEIVTMGVDGIDPRQTVGTYVAPEDWNALIQRDDVMLIDTRNDYEVGIGTFKGAINPNTDTFREFPSWVDQWVAENIEHAPSGAPKKVAMFCTGGIRCEKATAYLKAQGLDEVYHLQGGILKYLETVPAEESLWDGECFVFDNRVSVGHGLEPGPYQLCSVCREPFLSGEGAGGYARSFCETCETSVDSTTKRRALERQQQIDLAMARGSRHLGPNRSK
jgi:UPF0176 protein